MDNRFDNEAGHYHFVLSDVVEAIEMYGWDVVMDDIKDFYNSRLYMMSLLDEVQNV